MTTPISRIERLEAEINALKHILALIGFNVADWVSPNDASKLLGVSRSLIMEELHDAEQARAINKKWHCRYGLHYRNIAKPDAAKPTWQINWREFESVLNLPPEKRQTF